ncbi:MAG: RNA polymerase Rpb4 family protein [Candidatus Heimdallarchaeaceae archaeon]
MPRDVLDKKPLTISEAMRILQQRSEESELSYWQRVAYEHAMQNARIEPEESREILEKLLKEFDLSELSAFTIANILPPSPEELKDILQKEPKMLTETEINKMFEVIRPYIVKFNKEK